MTPCVTTAMYMYMYEYSLSRQNKSYGIRCLTTIILPIGIELQNKNTPTILYFIDIFKVRAIIDLILLLMA